MQDKNIFIHIPKTGGTTINTAMHNVYWQTNMDFNYRHFDIKTKVSTCGDIFDPVNFDRYKDYNVITMLRDPIDRAISEYSFFKERKPLFNLLKPVPGSLVEYVTNKQTANYMVGFLVGKQIYSKKKVERADLDRVIAAIEQIPIHVGIFEYFNESMGYFQEITGIKWHKKLEAKRMTFNRPVLNEVSEEIKQKIRENNELDIELYKYCLEKFAPIKQKYSSFKIDFIKSKYTHVIPYCSKTCFFEFCMENKYFIKQNFEFFKQLNFYLLQDLKVRDGKVFCSTWNSTFLTAINKSFPSSAFYDALITASNKSDEPLQNTMDIANALDEFFKQEGKKADKYYQPMTFDRSMVELAENKEKKGFFNKLFGK